MQDLLTIKIENNSELGPVVSSRVLAEQLNKQHKHIKATLKEMLEIRQNLGASIIENNYKDNMNRTQVEYLLTKKGFNMYMFNIQGYYDYKEAYIDKFEKMEEELKQQYQVPQTPMQALEMMFSVQKEQEQFNKRIETEVTGIRNIVGIETKNWRNDTNKILGAIAQHLGGGDKHKSIRTEAYKLLEEKGRCKLDQRLNNRRAKMISKGATKSQINKLSKLDVINDEPRLIEIYIAVIKNMAIKYGVDISQFEI
ncbi:Rha family transcriptional regulator [Staphylococcus xylosus]|uniref:Rha family transcriptional regulator n=1 Tax=Staphylococcus xylosus TaxID=1288 RepID=UPI001CDBE4B9|nr:Rha family transcriptional regulator [Staphylococcus xylosus]UBV34099.1 Rha family transcriptional regulator [Staphylococcus xylosus]